MPLFLMWKSNPRAKDLYPGGSFWVRRQIPQGKAPAQNPQPRHKGSLHLLAAGRDPSAPKRLMVSFQGPCGQDPFEIFGEEGPVLPIDIQHQPALLAAKSKAENLFHLEEAP
jgi:hypothetical protein